MENKDKLETEDDVQQVNYIVRSPRERWTCSTWDMCKEGDKKEV